MLRKLYLTNQQLFQKLSNGSKILKDNVANTLGPKGQNVILISKNGNPIITKDGVTVAKFVSLDDPFENAAVQILKQAAEKTNTMAGDGTTTSIVLSHTMLTEAQKYLAAGYNSTIIQRSMQKALDLLVEQLSLQVKKVESLKEIEYIAAISANNDPEIGKLIAEAVDKIGKNGAITIEDSRSLNTVLSIIEGFQFDSGLIASAFITNESRSLMQYDNPLILVTDHKIEFLDEILQSILEPAARDGRPLVIIAEDVVGQALAALVANVYRGSMRVSAIKAPCYGEERLQVLSDLALSVNANFISRNSGKTLRDFEFSDFGNAKTIEASKVSTIIVGGKCDWETIDNKIEALKAAMSKTDDLNECERISKRIARLSSSVAVISIGGSTEIEVIEKKHRVEDALLAVKAAQDEGILPGGGLALLKAQTQLECNEQDYESLKLGIKIIKSACEAPFRQMAINSDLSADVLLEQIKNSDYTLGCDFKDGELKDMFSSGIIDPFKVTRVALVNAVSSVSTLITANYAISEVEN